MPSFNVGRALGAGYEPREILRYLAGRGYQSPYEGSDEDIIRQHMVAGDRPYVTSTITYPQEEAPYVSQVELPRLPPPPLAPGLSDAPQYGARNSRTGQPMVSGYIPILDDPLEGATEIAGALESASPNLWSGRHGDAGAATLSELGRAAMRATSPLMAGAVAAAPVKTLRGLAMGSLMGSGTEEAALHYGVSPGYAAILGDVAGLGSGFLAAEAPWRSLPDMFRGPFAERGAVGKSLRQMTEKDFLREAATSKKSDFPEYAKWREANPTAGDELFDFSDPQPAIPEYPQQPEYTPTERADVSRITDVMLNPEVRTTLKALAERGMDMQPEPWYRTSPLYKVFQEVWGKLAPEKFIRYMQTTAAASPGMAVPNQIRTGGYYWMLDQLGKKIPAKMVTRINKLGRESRGLQASPASGYGSEYQNLIAQNMLDIRSGAINPIERPKNPRFAGNLIGQEADLTADRHYMRAVGMASKDPRFLADSVTNEVRNPKTGKKEKVTIKPKQMYERGELTMEDALQDPNLWESAPKKTEYALLQKFGQELAAEMDAVAMKKLGRKLTPAEFQDKLWVGAGSKSDIFPGTGLGTAPQSFLRLFAARVAYTAERMKMDPREVLRRHVKGEIPLLSLPAAAVVAGRPDDKDQAVPLSQF